MALLGLAVGLKAEVAPPPAPIHDLQSHLAPTQGPDLAPALGPDPIHALSPGAGAGPALLTAVHDHGHDQDPSLTLQAGGAGLALVAPPLPLLLA